MSQIRSIPNDKTQIAAEIYVLFRKFRYICTVVVQIATPFVFSSTYIPHRCFFFVFVLLTYAEC